MVAIVAAIVSWGWVKTYNWNPRNPMAMAQGGLRPPCGRATPCRAWRRRDLLHSRGHQRGWIVKTITVVLQCFCVFMFFCCGGWCFVLFWGVVLVNLGVFCILEVCFCCQRDFNKRIWSEIICRSVGMALSWDALGTKSTIYQYYIILSNIHEPWGTFYMVLYIPYPPSNMRRWLATSGGILLLLTTDWKEHGRRNRMVLPYIYIYTHTYTLRYIYIYICFTLYII